MSASARDIEIVRALVLEHLKGRRAKIYLFGSQATGKARRFSDIDVAVLPLESLPDATLLDLREALEESDAIRQVDLVNLADVNEAFRQRVIQEGVLWSG